MDKNRRKYLTGGAAIGLAAAASLSRNSHAQALTLNNVAALRAGSFSLDSSVELHYHTTVGDGGGGFFYKDTADTTSPDNGGTIIVDNSGNRFKRRHSGTVYSDWFGPVGTVTQVTTALQEFFEYVANNSLTGVLRGANYNVNAALLNTSVLTSFKIQTVGGKATINFDTQATSAIDFLIISRETIDCEISDIKVHANDMIAVPISIRNNSTPNNGGRITISRVEVRDIHDVGTSTSPTGILILGEFGSVRIEDCEINSVGRTGSGASCAGISISDLSGIATVTGCTVKNVSTPSDADADGLTVFGTSVGTIGAFLGARAVVQNNIFENCQGRSVKLQISDALVSGNQFRLISQSTISQGTIVDCQADNGNIIDNTMLILGAVPVGISFSAITLQNNRDTQSKASFVSNNRLHSDVAIPYFCTVVADQEYCDVQINNNTVSGNTVSKFTLFGTNDLSHLLGAKLTITENSFPSGWKLLSLSSTADFDFGTKLFLDIRDNDNTNESTLAETIDQSAAQFSCRDFIISNNSGCVDRVNWDFDMDDLKKGNSFFVASQTITNKPSGISSFFHVISDGYVQRCIKHPTGPEYVRTTHDHSTWKAWF